MSGGDRAGERGPTVSSEIAGRVIARALARGGRFAELFAERRTGLSLTLDGGKIEHVQHGDELGAAIRLVVGDSTYFGHADSLAEADLLAVADSLAQAVANGPAAVATLAAAATVPGQRVSHRPETVEVARKAELLRLCDDAGRATGAAIAELTASYGEARRAVQIYNSEGLAVADDRTRVRLSVQAIARRDGRAETGTQTRGGHAGFELFDDDPADVARAAARKALTALDAVDVPAGVMPVVVGNGFGGVLLHEAVGHGLEADAVQKGASVFAGRIGERLTGEFVTAYDDGRLPGAWGSDGIDDEGAETRRTPIIDGGVLTSFLYDRLTAERDGAAATGNGRRESFRHLPIPRMTNTYFAPGDATVEDLITSVDHGLYAVSFGGGQVEPATGDFVFGVSEAYLIEHGKVTAPLRGVTLVGNGLAALRAVEGIAGDLEIATGYCGKGGQRVAAGVGQPHVLIGELTVGGTSA